jgi:CarD family transcriptional regulator
MKFRTGQHAVYPGCGVGKIDEIQTMNGADMYVISFPDNKTRVWVPTKNAKTLGLRHLMTNATLKKALSKIPEQQAPHKTVTWNRRFKVYDEKIQTNRPEAIAEVLGELSAIQREKTLTFGEKRIFRQVYALFTREGALVREIDEDTFSSELKGWLEKPAPKTTVKHTQPVD